MKTNILPVIFMFICVTLQAQDKAAPGVNERVIAVISAPDFCDNIKKIVTSMSTNFESIKGDFKGSQASPGFLSGNAGENKWESAVVFSNVKKKGLIREEYRTENKIIKSGNLTGSTSITYKEFSCKYYLIESLPVGDYSQILQGLAEVFGQCLPNIEVGDWKFNDDKSELTYTKRVENKEIIIQFSVFKYDVCDINLNFIVNKY